MPKLNVANSVVDYLKNKAQPSSYTDRTKLYRESGLENRLGGYLGSEQQNIALLNHLRKQETPASAPVSSQEVIHAPYQAPQIPNVSGTPSNTLPPLVEQAMPAQPSTNVPDIVDELINQPTPELAIAEERKQAALTGEEQALAGKQATTGQEMAERGLAFSGIRTKAEESNIMESAAKKLGISRDFFEKVINAAQAESKSRISEQEKLEKAKPADKILEVGSRILRVTPEGKTEVLYEPPTKAETPKLLSVAEAKTLGVPYGTTEEEASKLGIIPKPKVGATIRGTTGATYESRLSAEVNKVYSGKYGKEFAREKALEILQKEFPNIEVWKDIYSRVPDNYEKNVEDKRQTASNIDQSILLEINEDLEDGANLSQLYEYYPEVSPSLLRSIYLNY